jgi:hypothetical protein
MQVYRSDLLYANLVPVIIPARLCRVVNQPAWCDAVVQSPDAARPVDAKTRCLGVLPIRFEGICADDQARPTTSGPLIFTHRPDRHWLHEWPLGLAYQLAKSQQRHGVPQHVVIGVDVGGGHSDVSVPH